MEVPSLDDRGAERGHGSLAAAPGLVARPVAPLTRHAFEVKSVFVHIKQQRAVSSVRECWFLC